MCRGGSHWWLERRDLTGSNLRDSNLRDSDLEDTELRDAYLRRANLTGAKLVQSVTLRVGSSMTPIRSRLSGCCAT